MGSWAQRENIAGNIYDVSPINVGLTSGWNLDPGSQTNREPQGAIKTDVHMEHAVQAMFFNRASRIASSRHGAIYDVRGNFDHLYTVLGQDVNAFVRGPTYPGGANAHVLIKVTRTSPSQPWNDWLRYRVREAKMHRAVYEKLGGVSQCLFVPMLFFAGVDYNTGMYFCIMQRPPGNVVVVSQLIKENKFTMHAYRAIEAAVANIWRIGAMLTDTSEGNVLISSKGFATIVDFDSSIVLPPDIRERMQLQVENLWRGHRHDKCYRILSSKQADLVSLFNFVTRQQSDMPMLKRLTINVYGRSSWFPDVNMLTLLFQTAEAFKQTHGKKTYKGLGWFKPVKKFFKPLRNDSDFQIPDIKMRRVLALPDAIKEVWRPRKHGGHREHVDRLPHRARNILTTASIPSIPSIPLIAHSRSQQGVPIIGNGGGNAPVISQKLADLVSNAKSSPFSRNNLKNMNTPKRGKNNNGVNNDAMNTSPITEEEFLGFKELPEKRKKYIIQQETERIRLTPMFDDFKRKLFGPTRQQGTYLLDSALKEMFPTVSWNALVKANKTSFRKKWGEKVALNLVENVVAKVLEKNIPQVSRNDRIKAGLDQLFGAKNRIGMTTYFL